MDLGIYTLHFVAGLLGRPRSITHTPNLYRGVDTWGVAVRDYGTCTVVCVWANDSAGPIRTKIQGTDGTLLMPGPPNVLRQLHHPAAGSRRGGRRRQGRPAPHGRGVPGVPAHDPAAGPRRTRHQTGSQPTRPRPGNGGPRLCRDPTWRRRSEPFSERSAASSGMVDPDATGTPTRPLRRLRWTARNPSGATLARLFGPRDTTAPDLAAGASVACPWGREVQIPHGGRDDQPMSSDQPDDPDRAAIESGRTFGERAAYFVAGRAVAATGRTTASSLPGSPPRRSRTPAPPVGGTLPGGYIRVVVAVIADPLADCGQRNDDALRAADVAITHASLLAAPPTRRGPVVRCQRSGLGAAGPG